MKSPLSELIQAENDFRFGKISAAEFERICEDIRLRHNTGLVCSSIGVRT